LFFQPDFKYSLKIEGKRRVVLLLILVWQMRVSMNLRIFFSYGLTQFMLVSVYRNLIYLLLGFIFSFGLNAKTTSLGEDPQWSDLDIFQETITRSEFTHFLSTVYCPRPEWWSAWISIGEDKASIRKFPQQEDWYDLYFEKDAKKPSSSIKAKSISQNLHGLTIALDPGHIGGAWSAMEKRHFSLNDDQPVKEGDLALAVAKNLVPALKELGAIPVLVRKKAEPVTQNRPLHFREHAVEWSQTVLGEDYNNTEKKNILIRERQELLFYRVDEIRARADIINHSIKPDLVISIHFNAAPWPDAEKRELVGRNDHHILVNGCYMGGELAYDDQRFELIWRLLNRWSVMEQNLAEALSHSFSQVTGLPTFSYKGPNALKIGEVPGVWARNLLANRIYRCPVVFLEPYVANSQAIYPRVQKWIKDGDDDAFGLVSEYTEAVLLGLQNWAAE
jgi:N-acetylmuramoyl-L-alanine amidase